MLRPKHLKVNRNWESIKESLRQYAYKGAKASVMSQ
jgi:hypothetical protein